MNEPDFTVLMRRVENGDTEAWDGLMSLIYTDLKRVAHSQMARINPGQTLSTTVLVHETFEKLAAQGGLPVSKRSDFFAMCAYAMRQIVIDHYRRRSAEKRSRDTEALAEHEHRRVNPDIDAALTELGGSLDQLAQRDPRLVEVFELSYFAGLSQAQIADRMQLAERSIQRLLARARAWVTAGLELGG